MACKQSAEASERGKALLLRAPFCLIGDFIQVAQYRAAAQLLADQSLTGRLLDIANWSLDADGGGKLCYLPIVED